MSERVWQPIPCACCRVCVCVCVSICVCARVRVLSVCLRVCVSSVDALARVVLLIISIEVAARAESFFSHFWWSSSQNHLCRDSSAQTWKEAMHVGVVMALVVLGSAVAWPRDGNCTWEIVHALEGVGMRETPHRYAARRQIHTQKHQQR